MRPLLVESVELSSDQRNVQLVLSTANLGNFQWDFSPSQARMLANALGTYASA